MDYLLFENFHLQNASISSNRKCGEKSACIRYQRILSSNQANRYLIDVEFMYIHVKALHTMPETVKLNEMFLIYQIITAQNFGSISYSLTGCGNMCIFELSTYEFSKYIL